MKITNLVLVLALSAATIIFASSGDVAERAVLSLLTGDHRLLLNCGLRD